MKTIFVKEIRKGNTDILADIYTQYREEFLNWLNSKFNCPEDIAKDIYQTSILQLYENICRNKLTELTSNIKTYLFAIGKNKFREWQRNKDQKISRVHLLNVSLEDGNTIEELQEKEGRFIQVEKQLQKMGDPCRRILELFYFEMRTVEDITDLLKYKNADTTKNLKYKCLRRLRKLFVDK